jgi:hypothetical protein
MTTVSFDAVVGRLQNVQEYEKYALANCVFHSDSKPSMLVFRDGWFRCLGCGRAGRWSSIWDKVHGRNITVTPEKTTSYSPPLQGNLEEVCYQAHTDLLQFPSLGWYLEMRGIQDRIETNEIGYVSGWYTFPVRSEQGAFQTAVLRTAPHVQKVSGLRYWCKSVPMPYVPDWFRYRRSKYVFVVYGILDALTLSSLGLPVITSTAGNNTFNASWLDDFRCPVYIIPDKGEEKEALSLSNQLSWRGNIIKLNFPYGEKDVNGFITTNQTDDLLSQLGHYIKE